MRLFRLTEDWRCAIPLYDFVSKCGREFEQLVALGTERVPCRCGKKRCIAKRDEVIRLRGYSVRNGGSHAQGFKAPVIYRDAKGSIRYPGHANSSETKRLEKLGFQRVEMTSIADIRRFEASINKDERRKYDNFIAAKDARFNAQQKASRDELRAAIATGSMVMVDSDRNSPTYGKKYVGQINEQQKDMIRASMEATDKRQTSDPHWDAGFHLDAFSNYSSNREEHRDVSTGWRGRKD